MKIVFSILMLFSYFSLFLSYNFFYIRKKSLNFFAEDIYLFMYLAFLITVFFVFLNFDYNFSLILFSITSSISNIGISLNNTPNNLHFLPEEKDHKINLNLGNIEESKSKKKNFRFFDNRQIYPNTSLASYIQNDKIEIKAKKLNEIKIKKQRLLMELEALKNG